MGRVYREFRGIVRWDEWGKNILQKKEWEFEFEMDVHV